MSTWLLAIGAGLLVAFIQYGLRDVRDVPGFIAAALRVAAIATIVALLLDAPLGFGKRAPTWTAIDQSVSMARGDSALWRAARDSARATHADSTFAFGDSIRPANIANAPADQSSHLRPIVERALGAGHPLTIVTDGELDDPEVVRTLPPGSRVVLLKHRAEVDAAVATLEVPRAAVSGDTIDIRVGLLAGGAGAQKGTLTVTLEGKPLATVAVDSIPAFGERTVTVRSRIDGATGPSILRAIVSTSGDKEAHNDTLAAAVDVSHAASAVFASTSPDFDSRFALAVLRGSLGIPTRGFFRVAPGEWRVDGPLTPVSEAEVRQALHDAPAAIIHGDTAAFGPPRAATLGPLALVVTSGMEGEWYPSAAPASPLAPALSGLAWDSLPPVGLTSAIPKGAWVGVEARRGRGEEKRAIVVGSDEPRRVAIVAASGLWRWRFRGGVASDAFTAFWGSIFDWLAAERADRRAAVVDERVVRAGEPLRWRRGTPTDSVVAVTLKQRGTGRVDSLTLRFAPGINVVETKALQPGVYEISTRGGTSVIPVSASREWLPRQPRIMAGATRGALSADTAPRLRATPWGFALAILLLCIEWILRRRRGLR